MRAPHRQSGRLIESVVNRKQLTRERAVLFIDKPHNKRIELTARGRHVFRLRESRAGDPSGLSFPGQALRPCSQLIRALYGR